MLHYTQYGQGQPIIILHGLLGSSENWKTIAQHLGEYFDVYTLDLRNHGMSFHHSDMTYHDMATDVIELVNHYHLYNPIIIGHSMGGKVAISVAKQIEAQLHKLIIVDIINKKYDNRHLDILNVMEDIAFGEFNSLSTLNIALEKDIPNPQLRGFILKNIIRKAIPFKWKVNIPAIKNNYHHISGPIPLDTPLEIPTLIIRGEHSDYITDTDIKTLHTTFETVQVDTIPNTGHWIHVESPKPFLNTVFNFILE